MKLTLHNIHIVYHPPVTQLTYESYHQTADANKIAELKAKFYAYQQQINITTKPTK